MVIQDTHENATHPCDILNIQNLRRSVNAPTNKREPLNKGEEDPNWKNTGPVLVPHARSQLSQIIPFLMSSPILQWEISLQSIEHRVKRNIMVTKKFEYTVPLKGKLTVSTWFSKLDSRVAKVETFEFRDARIESRESRVEDRESRNEEFWNIHELEFVRELAIHLPRKTITM